ncbi:MAG: magnesium transporter [Thermoplasmata archaeon]
MTYDWQKIFKESAPLLTLTAFIGVLGGQILNSVDKLIIELPVLLFLLPVMNGLGGNIGTILSARITSGLHAGYITSKMKDKELKENIYVGLLLGSATYLIVAVAVSTSTTVIDLTPMALELFLTIIGTGMLISVSIILLTVTLVIYSYKKRLDPDNVVVPVITTLGDFIGISCLIFMIWLVIL